MGVGRGHLKKLFCSGNYTDGKMFPYKAGVFRTLCFIATTLYINEELLEDFRSSAYVFSGVSPPPRPPQGGSLWMHGGAFQGEAGLPGT